jgi:hypothetical protein
MLFSMVESTTVEELACFMSHCFCFIRSRLALPFRNTILMVD